MKFVPRWHYKGLNKNTCNSIYTIKKTLQARIEFHKMHFSLKINSSTNVSARTQLKKKLLIRVLSVLYRVRTSQTKYIIHNITYTYKHSFVKRNHSPGIGLVCWLILKRQCHSRRANQIFNINKHFQLEFVTNQIYF